MYIEHSTLALDFGKTFGWCVHKDVHGSVKLNHKNKGDNYNEFFRYVADLISHNGIKTIAYEALAVGSYSLVTIAFGGYEAIVHMLARRMGCDVLTLNPSTLKKHTTGKGNCVKELMRYAVEERLPTVDFEKSDDNEIDAIALWLWATDPAAVAQEKLRVSIARTAKLAASRRKRAAKKLKGS